MGGGGEVLTKGTGERGHVRKEGRVSIAFETGDVKVKFSSSQRRC